jgi:hypothetical protein
MSGQATPRPSDAVPLGRTYRGRVTDRHVRPEEFDLGDAEPPRITDEQLHRVIAAEVVRMRDTEVHRITDADPGLTDDQRGRTRRYLVAMTIRTVCFIAAVFTPSPWRWMFAAGAVVLPYLAVVVANAGRERSDREGFSVTELRGRRRSLPGGE